MKYLRDIKLTFSCKSILLTTLLGERITSVDQLLQDTEFPDLTAALQTLVQRLDDYLQARPEMHDVCNPVLPSENFIRHWDDDKYANFRDVIHRYREWIEDAYYETDKSESIIKWQKVFGDDFAKAESKAVAKSTKHRCSPLRWDRSSRTPYRQCRPSAAKCLHTSRRPSHG